MLKKSKLLLLGASCLLGTSAIAADIKFKDPKGDDNGPGNYLYPTDAVYKPGSFDLRELSVDADGDKVTFGVKVDEKLEDPWGMGVGFAVQMIFIFIDKDGKEGSGHSKATPGLNVDFAKGHEWEKVVILSPQKAARVNAEIDSKAGEFKGDIIVPSKTRGKAKRIKGAVSLKSLGGGDPKDWGYQVVVQSNEGFPTKYDLLTRKVNEYEGQHRFGNGNDADCDPHVMDILAGKGEGKDSEKQAQYDQLAWECDAEGNSSKRATLTMVRK
jgi:hypothetical protein